MNQLMTVLSHWMKKKSSAKKGRRKATRGCRFESLEQRQLFAIAPIGRLGDLSTLLIPTGTTPVHFFADYRESPHNDELGYFFVDGPDGRITKRQDSDPFGAPLLSADGKPQYVRPADVGYANAALASNNSSVVFKSGEIGNLSKGKILDVFGDFYIAFYLVQGKSTQDWWTATASSKPNVWFSIGDANADGYEHFQSTQRRDSFYRPGLLQYKIEDSNLASAKRRIAGNDSDLNDFVFSVNIVPFATSDDYSVFNAGADFNGSPTPLKLNQNAGLLWNDYLPSNPYQKPVVTQVSLDDGDTWISVTDSRRNSLVLSDAELHGTLTVFPNGSIDFKPNVADTWWKTKPINSDPDPDPIEFEYRISDGLDTAEAFVTITHGFYQKGGPVDNRQQGKKMYLLAGGGDSTPFDEGRKRFFQEGSSGQDIVLIAQGTEQREFVNEVFDFYANGKSRSVTSLNITTREQANDPRITKIVNGADAIWFGGGAQSFYQSVWEGTSLFGALARAAASNVAIGGTSAGMAILGQAAYVDLPWDSVKSRFATQNPLDPRVNIAYQGSQLPFGALSAGINAPLHNFVTDTHFSARDRMGRLVAFAARSCTSGLGIDEETAVLMERVGNAWKWSVYGSGSAYVVTPSSNSVKPRLQDNNRLTFGPMNVYRLGPGSRNLTDVLNGSPSYRIWVTTGTVYTTENGGSLY